jgi:two-component system, cell cycle response regulator
MRILVAEDDLTSRTAIAGILRKRGFDAVEAVDGTAAWAWLQQPDAPRLAVLDWMMPQMDGLEVVQRVRALETERPPYIIMLTVRGDEADIIAGLEAGADDYLSKPFSPGELCARIGVGRRLIEVQEGLLASREALERQATHDPLTGMLNRRAILDHLHRELVRSARHGDALAIGMCDVDHFKQINDTHGHQAGDEALCGLARVLAKNLRQYDAVGRIGGDEFLVVTPVKEGTDRECLLLFDRLRKRVAESDIPTPAGGLSLTVSIGVACATIGSTQDELLRAADVALYGAKARGRNRAIYAAGGE